MKLRATSHQDLQDVRLAIAMLKQARALLKASDCPQSLKKVRSAIKSAEGAYRHAIRALPKEETK